MSIHGPCFDAGQSGLCGSECPVLLEGNCENVDESTLNNFLDDDNIDEETKLELIDLYG